MKGFLSPKPALFFALVLVFLSPAFGQSPLSGDWQGTLDINGNPMRIVWHVTAKADGSLTSTADNLDESIFGIKVKDTAMKDSDITFTVDDTVDVNGEQVHIAGSFTGKLNADKNQVTGMWTQTAPQEEGPYPMQLKHQAASATSGPAGQAAEPPMPPAKLVGDWEGALDTGTGHLRLVLHVTASADGALKATLDSVDQGATGIPVSSVSLKGWKLNITVDAVQGSYEGTVNGVATGIDGTWTQGAALPLNFKRAVAKAAAEPRPPTEMDGTWTGVLDTGAAQLHVVVKISNTSDGLIAQLQSPDQGQNWIPASGVEKKDNTLKLTFAGIGGEFAGKISPDLQTMEGTFTQMGNQMPLKLNRASGKS